MEINTPTQPINPSGAPIQPVSKPVNNKKSFFSIILGVLLLLVLIGGGAYYLGTKNSRTKLNIKPTQAPISTIPTKITIPDPTANWKMYTNTPLGFSFRYPHDWDTPSENLESTRTEIIFTPSSFDIRPMTLPEVVAYAGAYEEKAILTSKNILINGVQTTEYVVRLTKTSNGGLTYMTNSAPNPKSTIFKISMPFYKSTDQQLFETVLSTFKFTEISPSVAPGAAWVITCGDCDKFLTFLVTDPDGNQIGYIPSTKSYVQNIPDTSYGVDPGNAVDLRAWGRGTKYGIYTIQVNGFSNGNYNLNIGIADNLTTQSKTVNIAGSVTQNSVDTYKITIPSGTYTKVFP